MGKKTYFVNGHYYIIDDESKTIKRVVIQDDLNIPAEDLRQLVTLLAEALAKKEDG
ncbi:MAG: hypothetical protein LBB82_07700 [Treponema sp.]|jgi:hypothetical protein|nr:hypothetical protein [Treponema sp.]